MSFAYKESVDFANYLHRSDATPYRFSSIHFLLKDFGLVVSWNPSIFSFNPGDNYVVVWQDEFETVGPARAIINGAPAYKPNPKNWTSRVGVHSDGRLDNYTNSILNAYVQNNRLTIVAMKENYTSAMFHSQYCQEFTFGVFAAKIRLPYGQEIWPAWFVGGDADKFKLWWPTTGEIDIVEMVGGNKRPTLTDRNAHGIIHWNNQSNTMNPVYNQYLLAGWKISDGNRLNELQRVFELVSMNLFTLRSTLPNFQTLLILCGYSVVNGLSSCSWILVLVEIGCESTGRNNVYHETSIPDIWF